jgi:hypothetical protein
MVQRCSGHNNDSLCKFVKVTREQRKDRGNEHCAKVASGEIEVCQGKTRKDAGKKQKQISSLSKENGGEDSSDSDDIDSTTETDHQKKCCHSQKSAHVIDTSDRKSDNNC